MAIHILDPAEQGLPMPLIARQARLVVSPHMGARYAVMNIVELAPGEKNVPHAHAESEDTIFLVAGSGWVHDLKNRETLPIEAGCAVVIPPGVQHTVEAGANGMKSIGGPVPPDRTMMRGAPTSPEGGR